MNHNYQNDSGHQQWYGTQQNNQHVYQQQPPPPQGWAPYPAVPMPSRMARRRRRCNMLYSVLRHVSPIVPFVMIIITAYVYIRDLEFRDERNIAADDPAWMPLYLVVPVAVANIFWSFAVMIVQRRAVHRGRPIPQKVHGVVEVILAAGAAVCFALMIAYIKDKASDDYRGTYIYFPTSYEGAIAWLLGVQMIANALLAVRAAYEIKVERSQREQQETFIVH